jgi:transforming growth factor-beta-induced protein
MKNLRTLAVLACLLISAVPVTVSADATQDIPANAAATGSHDSLVAALAHAGLVEALQGEGPFTVFAPTDAAFEASGFNLSEFDNDEANATLTSVLLYHVFQGAVDAANVTDGLTVEMMNGENATFTVNNGTVMVGDATVTTADVMASNGIIHVIDAVLFPPSLQEPEEPADPPGEICYNIITHTIVAGATEEECGAYMYLEDYEMNGQNVTGCYNAVTHAVTNVSQSVCEGYMWTPPVSLAMTAAATTVHTALVAALDTAELVETLSGDANYTVFAPTDEAFAAAGIDLASFDTEEEIAVLADILLYHVVAGETLSSDLAEGTTTVTTANGDTLDITVDASGVTVGGATVTLADVPASNGVIHVIDAVLMPPADEVPGPFDGVECAVTIGAAEAGYAFTLPSVSVNVGDTVCWFWEDAAMPHNVRQIDGAASTTFVDGGVYSGAAASTVAFSHTFTEDMDFYYACEPHIGLKMFGEVIVGEGSPDPVVEPSAESSSEDTPGFLVSLSMVALIGAAFARRDRFNRA